MLNIFKRRFQKKKTVLRVLIDFNRDYKKNNSDKFSPGRKYYNYQEREFSYEEVKSFAISVVEKDFPREVEEITGMPVYDIRVNRTYNGSIELVFTIIFNTYQFIAGIKDFFDNIRLIRDTSTRFLRNRFADEYGEIFDITTDISYPNTDYYNYIDDMFMHKRGRHLLPHLLGNNDNGNGRDGFFYYLLFANIFLTAIIVYMVYKAVAQTYGW